LVFLKILPKATKLFQIAAEQGLAIAQLAPGLLYETGQGVPRRYTEAAKWYILAADQGNSTAHGNMRYL
jgi:TPR repeat protein